MCVARFRAYHGCADVAKDGRADGKTKAVSPRQLYKVVGPTGCVCAPPDPFAFITFAPTTARRGGSSTTALNGISSRLLIGQDLSVLTGGVQTAKPAFVLAVRLKGALRGGREAGGHAALRRCTFDAL